MAVFLGDLYLWLTDILSQMFAGIFGRRARRARRLISLNAEGVRLSTLNSVQHSQIMTMSDLPAQLNGPARQRNRRPQECVLRLEDGRALVRRLSPVVLPASRLRAAALLDLETATPFRHGDAHALTLRTTSGSGSSYAIVKRAILNPLIEACAAAELKIGRMEIVSGAEVHLVSDSDLQRMSSGAGTPGRGWAAALMLGAVVSGIGTMAHFAAQYDAAIKQVQRRTGQLAEEAKAVRNAMDQRAARIAEIQALRTSIEERKLVSAIWEELARVLPDSSFLTDMSVKDSTVSISGHSAAASSIIVALEGSDLFDQASFTAPVVKVPGNAGDRFAIDLKMGGK